MTRIKQVLLYRRDLRMRKGKIAAQCAHASRKVLLDRSHIDDHNQLVVPMDEAMTARLWGRFPKIVLSVAGEEELLAAHAAAQARGLPCSLVVDTDLTEFSGVPTQTTVAIGPGLAHSIDEVTGPAGLIATKLA